MGNHSARSGTHRRLFVAAALPVELRTFAHASANRCAQAYGGRCVSEENLHVTLAFIGSVPDGAVPRLTEALQNGFADGCGARVGVGGVVARPSVNHARLLALELTDPDGALAALAGRVTDAVVRSADGFAPGSATFWPHVTLVRFSRPTGVRRSPSSQSEHVFDISRIALYDSQTARGGPPRYHEILGITLSNTPQRSPSNG